jgi:hypothetical protein
VPGAVRVKGKVWRASTPPEGRIFQVVTAEPPLGNVSHASRGIYGLIGILMS